jgi:hypothetical protein
MIRSPESEQLERLLRAQAAVAYCMMLDGPIYAPVFERYEREIAALRDREDAMSRARRVLEGHATLSVAADGDVKAIA